MKQAESRCVVARLPGIVIVAVLCLCGIRCRTHGAEPGMIQHKASYECPLTAKPVTVDGVLGEKAWREAEVIREFSIPGTHTAPRRETEARIMWDKRYLYVAFKATDQDILGIHAARDSDTYRDDVLEFFFKTDPERRTYYNLEINPLGTIRDGYHYSGKKGVFQKSKNWNCAGLKIGVKIVGTLNDWRDRDKRWQLEIAIPFSSLPSLKGGTPRPGDVWRFHLARIERSVRSPKGRELTSCAPLPKANFHSPQGWLPLKFQGVKSPPQQRKR